MANTAAQIQYRQEYINAFEVRSSKFQVGATKELVIKGNSAVFPVIGSGGRTAVTRGLNGLIPSAENEFTQKTATLVEYHDKPQMTDFNIFSSQGDARRQLIDQSIGVLNRKKNELAIATLNTATNDTGSAATLSLSLLMKAKAILGNNDVDTSEEDKMFLALTPAAEAYAMQLPQWSSADYVDVKPFGSSMNALKMRRWNGLNIIVSSQLPGIATNAEKCFMWHSDALGMAINTGDMTVKSGEDEENAYFWARASAYMGTVLLQNGGVCVINHDGSAYAAS